MATMTNSEYLGHWSVVADEPSMEEFALVDEGQPSDSGARRGIFRFLRILTTLVLIVAMLLYFTTPFSNFFTGLQRRWLPQGNGIQRIPLAPDRTSSPRLRT